MPVTQPAGREVVFTGKGAVEVRLAEAGEPGPREALIRISRSLISSGTEMIALDRLFDPDTHWDDWVKYPFRAGYSCVGRVAALGEGTSPDAPAIGSRVALRGFHGDWAIHPVDQLVLVPDGVSDSDASWFGLACIAQVALRRAEPKLGDTTAVVGAGLLGQLLVQYSRVMGAEAVICIDTALPRLEMARSHGATHVLAAVAGDGRAGLLELTGSRLADVVYDATGNAEAFTGSLQLARAYGRVVLMGDTGRCAATINLGTILLGGLSVVGAHDDHPPAQASPHDPWTHGRMAELFLELVRRGQMVVDTLTTHRFPGDEAPGAYELLREHRAEAMGVILEWD